MKIKQLFTVLLASTSLITANLFFVANAAVNHEDGSMKLTWSNQNTFLNQNSFIEQEIVPVNTNSMSDGAQFRWSNHYSFSFCWESASKLTAANRCGFASISLGSKKGENYFGNFDFVLWNGINYSVLKSETGANCEKNREAGYIENTQTFLIDCWKPIVVQMNTPYLLRIQWDSSNKSGDENWWSASFTNKKTNETIIIGKIKAYGNNFESQLASLESTTLYYGDAVSCSQVPVIDARFAAPRSPNTVATLQSYTKGSCVNAWSQPSKEFNGYQSVRLGGINPESREAAPLATPSASPAPTDSPSPTPSATKTLVKTKPNAPVFSGIKIFGNTLNINVNLNSSEPDIVYLIAPKLTGDINQKILADVQGDNASWSIKFDPKNIKGNIPISFVSVKDGISSSETKIEYVLPVAESKASSIIKSPNPPTAISSRLTGENLIVSAKIVSAGNAAATGVSLYSKVLDIARKSPLKGDLLNNSVVFSIPVNSQVLSKKIDLNLFALNKVGASKTVIRSYKLPVPKSQTFTDKTQAIETVICVKGPTARTFASKTCPPGWQTK